MERSEFYTHGAATAASVVVLELGDSYGLGFVAEGKIVSCLHLVTGETSVRVHFSDGRSREVYQALSCDTRRDLAVLEVPLMQARSLHVATDKLAQEGESVFLYGMVSEVARLKWVEAKVSSIQVMGGWLTVYRLVGDIPPDVSGSPLLNARGEVLGVATVGETEDGVVVLGVPWRYVAAMLTAPEPRTFASIKTAAQKHVKREIPQHPMSLLDGSTTTGLQHVIHAIAGAIQVGAPAYNQGDVERCYQVYANAARRIVESRPDCPGAQRAMRQGLERASTMDNIDSQAWAMRDAFDGLLSVIEKWFRSQVGERKDPKPTFLN